MSVIWHDLECGRYAADLPLWRSLARTYAGPVLDVGAGTGRVTLELARANHAVTALDSDPDLLKELGRRSDGMEVTTVAADAREFDLGRQFSLCIVPMQTIQLLGGSSGRGSFLRCARRHLLRGGRLAVAIADELDIFEVAPGIAAPLPDVCERDGVLYSSAPTAVRADGDGYVLERRREVVSPAGELSGETDRIHLDRLDRAALEREARGAGLSPVAPERVPATADHVGSLVVMLDG